MALIKSVQMKTYLSMGIVICLFLGIVSIGIQWGLPNIISWHPDSIAGGKSLYFTDKLIEPWGFKYPRGHFIINAAAYAPIISSWKRNPLNLENLNQQESYMISVHRYGRLILVSRWISAVMGALMIVGVILSSLLLFQSRLSAFFAGLSLASTQLFIMYSQLGNLDVPAAFWFIWAFYFMVRSAYGNQWLHHGLFGFTLAMSICTKDHLAGYAIGMSISYVILRWEKLKTDSDLMNPDSLGQKPAIHGLLKKILTTKIIFSFAICVFVFALLNDLLTHPSAFFTRMSHWIGGPGVQDYNQDFNGQFSLLLEALGHYYYAVGWPLLFSLLVGICYLWVKDKIKLAAILMPVLVFYVIVIVSIKMSAPRFFMPVYGLSALIIGKLFADSLIFFKKKYSICFRILIIAVFSLSLLYAIGISLEMRHDTRAVCEEWFLNHVPKSASIASLAPPMYSPRLSNYGYHNFSIRIKTDSINDETLLSANPRYPDYLVISENWWNSKRFDEGFKRSLATGMLGYLPIHYIENLYLFPKKTIFCWAGWPKKKTAFVSPSIQIYKKTQ